MRLGILQRLLGKLAMIAPGGYTVRPWLQRRRGVRIGRRVWISQLVYIDELHPDQVTIEDDAIIGLRCTIFAHFYTGSYRPGDKVGRVVIGRRAFIGPNCTILSDVTVGDGAVVMAGTVVSRNVPPGVVFGPPPAVPLAKITQPLVNDGEVSYAKFIFGLKRL